MSEQSVASARASVMVYDSGLKKWVASGSSSGLAKVHIYHHQENNTFRVVGRKVQDHEVVINCCILKGLKYFQATPTFHQWRDSSQIHGLNFASRDDAETFALAMERCIDILGHSSMYLSNQRSSNQPLYQTIGHSGVSLDDYAEYRGWMNNENGERKQTSEYGHYRTSHVATNHASHPTTPGVGGMPSPSAYSHHRANSAPPPMAQPNQQQAPSLAPPTPAAPPPPPPPPPPPSANQGMATMPRLHPKAEPDQETSETSLAAALATAKLKKTPSKTNDAAVPEAKPFQMKGMACMLDEMTRTLARRRAQTDSNIDAESTGSGDSNRSFNRQTSASACSPSRNSGGESPQSFRRSDMESDSKGQIVVDMYQIEKMKQDLLNEMKVEMNKIKQDIIDAIRMELNRR